MATLSKEQQAAVTLAQRGGNGAIVARAGSGKTFTLRAIADTIEAPTLLLAFNRAIAQEARERFPSHVTATTMHALAFRHVVARDPALRRKFEASSSTRHDDWCTLVGLDPRDPDHSTHLAAIRDVLQAFLVSGDERLSRRHVRDELRRHLHTTLHASAREDRERWWLRRAERTWQRVTDRHDPAPLGHDAYLKLYALARPRLPGDLLLIDEAQDLAPVMLQLLTVQDAPRILVGDPAQGIYAFRGAMDAMAASGYPEVRLTQSFRFGPEIAAVAQRALRIVAPGAKLRGAGTSGEVHFDRPIASGRRTILCRTTLGALEAMLEHGDVGVHLVGGVSDILRHLERATTARREPPHDEARIGRRSGPGTPSHAAWDAFVAEADVTPGPLRVARHLAERHGDDLPRLASRIRTLQCGEREAQVTITTIHRSKGREWDDVVLWSDLREVATTPGALARAADVTDARGEVHLLYVALTRARKRLDLTRLSPMLKQFLARG